VFFDGFAQYPFMEMGKRKVLAAGKLNRYLASDDTFVAVAVGESGQLEAITVAQRFPWGEKHFHMGMAHVQELLVSPEIGDDGEQRRLRERLLGKVSDWAKQAGIQHLAGRFPTEDFRSIQAVETMGGVLVDTICTYTYNTHVVRRPPPVRRLYEIRLYEDGDRKDILNLCAESFSETRFSRDPTFHKQDINSFYEDWGERLCAGEMAERLLVATTTHGEVVGFIGYKLLKDLEKWGEIRVRGGGLGAVSPRAAGAYLALLHQSFVQDTAITDLAEMESQIQNAGVIKIWHKLKCQPVRVTHTMHILLR